MSTELQVQVGGSESAGGLLPGEPPRCCAGRLIELPAILALVAQCANQLGDFGRQRKTMTAEVERHHRVVVDDVVHGEFEQSCVLQPEEECQGASRADIERQRIVAEAPVQVFGLA
ncbi:hypothetical protein ACFYWX_38625 [Streptomyces sp. NPDC002888]|uniref:hypothetical protein n=1 Tax=Streptomyces sp. NPDC002888 TaxID=3364668 RepID=UPI0036A96229